MYDFRENWQLYDGEYSWCAIIITYIANIYLVLGFIPITLHVVIH